MQLVDQKKRSSPEELEPILYAALIDSMCQNFWPIFFGSVCAAVAAVMTALKTGNVLLWPCAVLIIGIGTIRAFQMRKYEQRTAPLTLRAGQILGAALYGRRALLCRRARRLVLHHHLRQRRPRRASGLCRRDDRLHRGRRRAQLRPSKDHPEPHPAGMRTDVARAGDARRILLSRPCRAAGAVLHRAEGHQPQPARDLRQGADLELSRGRSRRPVRHRAQQHAARAVHVPRRRPARGDEPPLQRDDAAAGQFRRARRQRRPTSSTPAFSPARSRRPAAG